MGGWWQKTACENGKIGTTGYWLGQRAMKGNLRHMRLRNIFRGLVRGGKGRILWRQKYRRMRQRRAENSGIYVMPALLPGELYLTCWCTMLRATLVSVISVYT